MKTSEWTQRYLSYVTTSGCEKPNTVRTSTSPRLKAFSAAFPDIEVEDISVIQLMEWIISLQVSPSTKHLYLRCIKAALRRGKRIGLNGDSKLLEASPKDLPSIIERQKAALTEQQESRLLHLASRHNLGIGIYLARYAGLRLQEIMHLLWENIDLSLNVLHIKATDDWSPKNNREIELPIVPELAAYLRSNARLRGHVMAKKNGEPYKRPPQTALESLFKKAGILTGHWHILRHTFATRLLQRGVPAHAVSSLLNHKSLSVVQKYDHSVALDYADVASG